MSFLETLLRFDQHLLQKLYTGLRPENERLHEAVNNLMLVTNTLGEFMVYPLVLVALWYSARLPRVFLSRALIISFSIALAAGVTGIFKDVADRSRPAWVFMEPQLELQDESVLPAWRYGAAPEAKPAEWLNESFGYRVEFDDPRGPLLRSKSFPSGHSLFAFAVATALAAYFPFLAPHLFAFAAVSSFSRAWGAHHFMFDLVAGAFLGIFVVLFALWGIRWLLAWRLRRKRPPEWWVRWLAEGLPPQPLPHRAPRRWARHIAFWVALLAYAPLVVVAAILQWAPLAWAAGPLVVLGYVLGWRLLEYALRRMPRFQAPRPSAADARVEPTLQSPASTWPTPRYGYPSTRGAEGTNGKRASLA